jgi:AmmeMemoRadiSam system protein A
VTTFEQATVLARYARAVVGAALGGERAPAPHGGVFDEPGASFVSLHWVGGRLQGCIGSLEPRRPHADDVAKNARAAALDDPRARMLSLDDVDALDVEVSVLGPVEPIVAGDEAEACAQLETGVDGVVFVWRQHRATFIPQMWDHFGDARTLVAELKLKAGVPADFWAPDARLLHYRATIGLDPAPLRESTSAAHPPGDEPPRR